MNRVYVKTDAEGRIIAINSDAFIDSLSEWLCIDQGIGDRYHHAQANYIGSLHDDNGLLLYKLENGKPVKRTEAELVAEQNTKPTITTLKDRLEKIEKVIDKIKGLLGVKE